MKPPSNFITDVDVLEAYNEDGGGTPLTPRYLVRPESEEELVEIVKYCSMEKIPLNPTGARTCDTGSGLSDGGLLVSFEKMKSIVEINREELYADVQPGVYLYDLKLKLQELDLFYPPDPSSEKIATLGGTVATNAAGARSFKYGHTNNHIDALRVVTSPGRVLEINNAQVKKISSGPASLQRMTDLWVGSEGVLGSFSSIRLKLIKGVPEAFAVCAFFKNAEDMHRFNIAVNDRQVAGISPRSLEFMDETCLRLIKDSGKFKQVPEKGSVVVISEQEFEEGQKDHYLDSWLAALEKFDALVEETIFADSEAKIQALRELRHYVPSNIWEKGKEVAAQGGKKVSTDWVVPVRKLPQMMKKAEPVCESFGFPAERTYRYAHLGDGHPHYNFVPENTAETEKCLALREELSKLALSFGGAVAGEHGVGKLRKNLINIENQQSNLKNKLLKSLKTEIDPGNIMAPGNLL